MNAEELDQALLGLAPTALAPRPALPTAAGPAAQAALRLVGSVPPKNDTEDTERERRALEQRRARIARARSELEAERIKSPKLLGALRQLDTRCALLLGPSGIGKTAAAHWARERHRGLWVSARDLGACERRHPLGEDIPRLLRQSLDAPVLYLDDLGTEDSRDLGVLQYVVDQRYANGRAMFVTSGLTMADLPAYFGAPYVRRLVEQHVRRSDGSEWPVLFVDAHPPGGANG
jgi:DNA replication protein DnaC